MVFSLTRIFFLIFITFPPFETHLTYEDYITKARKYFEENKFQESINFATKALELALESREEEEALKIIYADLIGLESIDSAFVVLKKLRPYLHSQEAVYILEDFLRLAIQKAEYEKGLEASGMLEEKNDTLKLLNSLCYIGLNRLGEALSELEGTKLPEVHYIKAYINYKLSNKSQALKEIEKTEINLLKFIVLYDMGHMEEIITLTDSISSLDENERIYADAISCLAMDSLKYRKLKKCLENFLRNYPEHEVTPVIKLLLADLYVQKGQYRHTVNLLRKIKPSIFQDSVLIARYYRVKSDLDYRTQRLNRAKALYDTLLNYFKAYVDTNFIHFRRGKIYYLKGNLGMAIQDLQCVSRNSKYYGWGMYYMAKVKIKLGNLDDALKILRYLEVHAENKELKYYALKLKGELYEKKNLFLLARENYIKASEFASSKEMKYELLYRAEYCNYRLGRYKSPPELNIKYIEKYPESPKNPELLYELFLYFWKTGNQRRALEFLEKLVEDYPDKEPSLIALKYYLDVPRRYLNQSLFEKFAENTTVFKNEAYLLLGEYMEKIGNEEEAIRYYSLVKGKLEDEANIRIMDILYRNKKLDELINYAERFIENVNTRAGFNALIYKIKALKEKGLEDAMWNLITRYEKESFANKTEFLIFVSDLYMEKGDSLRALRVLENAEKSAQSKKERKKIQEKIKKIIGGL